MHVFTTRIYKQLFVQLSGVTEYYKIFEELVSDQAYFFIEEVCSQICLAFRLGQELIIEIVSHTSEKLKKSNIVNFYFLYRIFKDVSHICQKKIGL